MDLFLITREAVNNFRRAISLERPPRALHELDTGLHAIEGVLNDWFLISKESVQAMRDGLADMPIDFTKIIHELDSGLHITEEVPVDFKEDIPEPECPCVICGNDFTPFKYCPEDHRPFLLTEIECVMCNCAIALPQPAYKYQLVAAYASNDWSEVGGEPIKCTYRGCPSVSPA